MPNCKRCDKPLRSIGKERENGKDFDGNKGHDWTDRQYHKKCWKYIQDEKWRQVSYVLDAETNHDL